MPQPKTGVSKWHTDIGIWFYVVRQSSLNKDNIIRITNVCKPLKCSEFPDGIYNRVWIPAPNLKTGV